MQAAPTSLFAIFGIIALVGVIVAVALMFFKGGGDK